MLASYSVQNEPTDQRVKQGREIEKVVFPGDTVAASSHDTKVSLPLLLKNQH